MRTREVKVTLDIETANSTEDALAYDVGFVAHYNDGEIIERHSYIVRDVFFNMADLMQTAYYAEKSAGQNIPVDVTPVKQVKKTPGAKPGMVIYHTYNTIYVNPYADIVVDTLNAEKKG